MKKVKWMGILLSGILSATVLSAPIAGMADDWVEVNYPNYTVRGDINSDGTFEVLDLVRMQRYLHGQYDMARQGMYNADINDDGTVDVFDLAYMKRRLPLGEPGYTVRLDHLSYQEGFYRKTTEPSVVIQNTTGLKRYLEPYIETLMSGGQFVIPVVEEEVLAQYLELYNDEFFKENVLCLHPIAQGSGSGLMYKVTDFAMNDGTLEIHYADTYDPHMSYPDVETSVLAQVAIPKELFHVKDVKWIYQEQETFTPDIASGYTANVTDTAWSEAMRGNGSAVIRTAEELDTWASARFQDAVVRSLKKTYDDVYFTENVLIVDLYAQRQTDSVLAEVMKVSKTGNSIVLAYDDVSSTDDVMVSRPYVGVELTQVTVPAAQYHDETVTREFTWQTPVEASYEEVDIDGLPLVLPPGMDVDGADTSYVKDYSMEGEWVTTPEEMEAYLEKCLTEAGMAMFASAFRREDFNGKAAYMSMGIDLIGSTHTCESVMQQTKDGSLVMTMAQKQPLGCCGGSFLSALWVDASYAGSSVGIRTFNQNDDNIPSGGEVFIYRNPDSDHYNHSCAALAVNQYRFGDEGSVVLYRASSGGGSSEFGGFTEVCEIAFDPDDMPFSDDYTEVPGPIFDIDDSGVVPWSATTYESERFRIVWEEMFIKVEYETGGTWYSEIVEYQSIDL